jgi:NAD(P)-dependent dehydrogenase (short-subunit alcohol dehydrogenase family)
MRSRASGRASRKNREERLMKYGAVYPSLKSRTVLVTGGGSGIGEAIVRHFAAQGSKVGFIDINEKASKTLVGAIRRRRQKVHFEHADLTDIDALKTAIARIRDELGPITILVNNAAHDERHTLEDVTPEYFDNRIAVNLRHQFFCAQAVVPDMKKAGGGAIINMTSGSWVIGSSGMPVYVAAKAATYGLVRGLARDLGPFNIRVNSIAPGWIMTERQLKLWWSKEAEERLMMDQCLKRRLYPDDMARVALFYASDEASSITNQNVIADAGWA